MKSAKEVPRYKTREFRWKPAVITMCFMIPDRHAANKEN